MPVFVRPARVVVIEDGGAGGGAVVTLLVAAALAGPIVAKVLGWIATPVTVAMWTAVGLAVATAVALPWWVKRKRPMSAGGSFLDGPELRARERVQLPAEPPRRAIEAAKALPLPAGQRDRLSVATNAIQPANRDRQKAALSTAETRREQVR